MSKQTKTVTPEAVNRLNEELNKPSTEGHPLGMITGNTEKPAVAEPDALKELIESFTMFHKMKSLAMMELAEKIQAYARPSLEADRVKQQAELAKYDKYVKGATVNTSTETPAPPKPKGSKGGDNSAYDYFINALEQVAKEPVKKAVILERMTADGYKGSGQVASVIEKAKAEGKLKTKGKGRAMVYVFKG